MATVLAGNSLSLNILQKTIRVKISNLYPSLFFQKFLWKNQSESECSFSLLKLHSRPTDKDIGQRKKTDKDKDTNIFSCGNISFGNLSFPLCYSFTALYICILYFVFVFLSVAASQRTHWPSQYRRAWASTSHSRCLTLLPYLIFSYLISSYLILSYPPHPLDHLRLRRHVSLPAKVRRQADHDHDHNDPADHIVDHTANNDHTTEQAKLERVLNRFLGSRRWGARTWSAGKTAGAKADLWGGACSRHSYWPCRGGRRGRWQFCQGWYFRKF